MAIEQLARPCWYARYDGGEDYENQIHYGTEPQAQKAAAEIRADDEPGETAAVETGQTRQGRAKAIGLLGLQEAGDA